jgi:protein involved in polysaccharide export with SLBB domain
MEDLPVLLANVPDRVNTTLEIAAASGTMLIEDFHKVQGQALNLAKSLGYAGTSYVGVQSPIAVATSANGTDKAPAKGRTDRRYFVRLVVGMDRMTFQGRDVTWQELPAILEKLPNRSSTVLELASASGGLTVEHFDAAVAQVNPLVTQHELEYLSFVGTHPLGSKGSAPQELSAEDNKTPATRRAGSKLEFRIALYYAYGSEWEAARKVEYDTWLKRLGQERMPGKGYDWVPLDEKAEKGRIIPGCISAERDGRTYLLVSYTPGQVMLKEDGNAMWGLESVYRTTDAENRPAVGFRFDDRGSELFLDLTKGNLKRNLAIILDGRVLSVGKVMSPIHGEMIIAGQFTQREVDNLIESLRIGMPAVADPATQPGGHGAFGPVTERVVNHTGDSCLIDLESGKVVTPPQEVFQDTSQSIQWTKRNGIDAGGSVAKISPGLIGFDMISIPVSNNLWDTATSKLLMETVSFCQPGNPISLVAKEIPATFIIKTREGGVGVLQITGFTHEPEGVRFRYKLLWKPALDRKPAWQSATQPAATLPSLSELYQDAYNVYILGNVQRPGVYSVPRDRQPPLTLRNLLAVAGAQTETKGLSAQVLRATPDGVNQRFAVDVDDLLAGTVADPPLVENDLVLVQPADRWNPTVRKNPTSADVKITGEVQRPGVYNVDNAKVTLSRMLAGAGFDLAKVQQTRITVLRRKDGNEQTPISVELSGVLSGTVPDFEIVPGDVIVVTLAPLPTTRQGSPATQSAEAGR